jgi:tetratricopeptide (TPR) repeat protein
LLVCLVGASASLARSHGSATLDPADDNFKQGMAMIRKGNYEGGIDSFKQAVYFSRNQYNPPAYKYLALCYKATRNYGKAVEAFGSYFNQTTERDPDAHIEEAECYMGMGDFNKARKEVETASRDSVYGAPTARFRYAQGEIDEKLADKSFEKEGSYSQAEDFYDEAIQEKPHYTEAWMGKGRCQVKQKHWNDALRTYRTILEKGPLLHPNLEELYYNMGTCLVSHGDHQGALDHWHMALEQNPDSYDAHLAIAGILDQEHHFSSALKEYEKAIRCAPKDSPSVQMLMNRMQWIEQQIKPKEAPVEIKPSPSMRQQAEDEAQPQVTQPPPGKDAGF